MKFIPQYIEEYAELHTKVCASTVLNELERRTYLEVMQPHMLSGYLQGQFLAFLSRIKRPQRILELGTYTGYSAICLAQGLVEDGLLHTIDNNPELETIASKFIQQANLKDKIYQHQGDAIDIIPTLKEDWDIVFLDADKLNYSTYYNMVLPCLKIGGLVIADNVLWYGQVTKDSTEKRANALAAFNNEVQQDSRVKNVLLPLRDGLMLIEKVAD